MRLHCQIVLTVIAAALLATPAPAQDKVRFAKAFPTLFQFTPVDVGIAKGIFAKHGIDMDVTSFTGAAHEQQAFAAGAIDMSVGAGPELAFVAKGAPDLGVAEVADRPLGITLSVLADSPYKTIADLKGQTITGASVGDQTEWMVRELSRQQGWGPDGFKFVPLGAPQAQIAALLTHQVAADPMDITTAVELQDQGKTRILVRYGDIVKQYINHVIFASNDFIANHPGDVRNVIAAWFESVAYFKSHKDESVKIAAGVLKIPEPVVSQVYDNAVGMLTDNGHFDPKGLAVLQRSFVEMKMLPEAPDMSKLYTEKFLPQS